MSAPPEDLPPAYDSTLAPPPSSNTPSSPPTYTSATTAPQRTNLPVTNSSLTLYLIGPTIAPSHDLNTPLYLLNRPPTTGLRDVYQISKVLYRLSDTTGEGRIRQRERRIYDFWSNFKTSVDVAGKCGTSTTYKGVCITSYSTLWSSCSVKEHFSCGRSMRARFKKEQGLEWKDTSGSLLAVEHRGDENTPPRLELKMELPEKQLDLLVTCWCARVFRENVDADKSPEASWERSEYNKNVATKEGGAFDRKLTDWVLPDP